ncbi:MAG: SRPBCC family protein [Pseudomonadota bacterium]|nr:SRPBCC family protein [Pseudomonadota bacterium]
MKLKNAFDLDLPFGEAWKMLLDIERIVPCMPGARLIEILDDRTYRGNVSVRLGPVALTFTGTATFEEIDQAGMYARVKAEGADEKGRGGAAAIVVFRLEPAGTCSRVSVETDLTLSGSVAQYGRGVGLIQDIAGQLITQFADNLRTELAAGVAETAIHTGGGNKIPAAKPLPLLALIGVAIKRWVTGLLKRG